jgi:hypothetical protein
MTVTGASRNPRLTANFVSATWSAAATGRTQKASSADAYDPTLHLLIAKFEPTRFYSALGDSTRNDPSRHQGE